MVQTKWGLVYGNLGLLTGSELALEIYEIPHAIQLKSICSRTQMHKNRIKSEASMDLLTYHLILDSVSGAPFPNTFCCILSDLLVSPLLGEYRMDPYNNQSFRIDKINQQFVLKSNSFYFHYLLSCTVRPFKVLLKICNCVLRDEPAYQCKFFTEKYIVSEV